MSKDIRLIIRELINKELEEISTSGGAGSYLTPKAFKDKSKTLRPALCENIILQKGEGNWPYSLEIEGDKFNVGIHKKENGTILQIANPVANNLKEKLVNFLNTNNIKYDKSFTGAFFIEDWEQWFNKDQYLQEASYRKFKGKVSESTTNQKIRKALKEMRNSVRTMNHLVDFSNKLKEEMNGTDWSIVKEQIDLLSNQLNEIQTKLKTLYK
jgi:hypothetical protein